MRERGYLYVNSHREFLEKYAKKPANTSGRTKRQIVLDFEKRNPQMFTFSDLHSDECRCELCWEVFQERWIRGND